jgi:DNA polymerase-3 subunit delta
LRRFPGSLVFKFPAMDGLAFLQEIEHVEPGPVYVLHGDEAFLKRLILTALRRRVLGTSDDTFGLSVHVGEKAGFASVQDELATLPFLSARRLVVVETAEPFVTRHRAALEKYVTQPAPHGVLVLDVQSWPANTRLAKALGSEATLVCKTPPAYRLPEWCTQWAASQHGKQLTGAAARLLVDLIGPDLGQLDQELAKLAVYVGAAARIDDKDVDRLVASSRLETTWKIFDAIGNGQTAEALAILARLFDQGEEPLRILGAFGLQLRRLAQVARLCRHGQTLADSMEQAGVPPFGQRGCEQQLRHLGRRRADQLYDWLLEVDLGLKGSSQLPPRTLLERLVVRLARKATGDA